MDERPDIDDPRVAGALGSAPSDAAHEPPGSPALDAQLDAQLDARLRALPAAVVSPAVSARIGEAARASLAGGGRGWGAAFDALCLATSVWLAAWALVFLAA